MSELITSPRHTILIDGYGFVFRAYHAVPPLTRPDGVAVGAVFGFTSMLMKLMGDIKATHIAVIFDSGKKTFRNDLYPAYKAHRPPAPEDLIPQFAIVREAARALNLTIIEQEGYEADDIIATLARKALSIDETVTIVSSDKDLMQLINHQVRMYDPVKSRIIGEQQVIEKFGVCPDKVADVLAMIGDASDNIPGVPGIGPKGAAELINNFNSLEELFQRTSEIKQNRKREIIENNIDIAILSKKLVTLYDQVPLEVTLDCLEKKDVNLAHLTEFLKAQGFRSLVTRAQNQFASAIKLTEPTELINQDKDYSYLTDKTQLFLWITNIKKAGYVSILPQTDNNILIGIGLSIGDDTCFVPINNDLNSQPSLLLEKKIGLYFKDVISSLSEILIDKSILKIFYDYKQFLHIFYGIEVTPTSDVLLMSYSLNGTSINPDLNNMIAAYLAITSVNITDLTGTGRNKIPINQIEIQKLANYVGARTEYIFKIYTILKQDLFKAKSLTIYEILERPLSYILYKMEIAGIKIDRRRLKLMSKDFEQRLVILEKEIFNITGCEFNIGSPKQLGEVLFSQMGLSAGKASKTGNLSTGADILETLSEQGHGIADLLLEWRSLSKLKNTYTDNLVELADPKTDRVHTTFSMAATSTGRLSSIDPNLQNIPIRSEEGNKIRSCFIAKEGYKLLSADYSQIELRILAHIADIPSLKLAFRENRDIHTATASQIFGVAHDQVDANMRRKAKAINFGIIYGISSFGLAKQLSISRADASLYIKAYFREYPGIEKYMEDTKNFARTHGYVQTLYGRRCYVRGINDSNAVVRTLTERAAINAPIQGAAADIIKSAMVKIPSILKRENLSAIMLLQVHDELLFEVPASQAEHTASIIKKIMENVINLSVDLIVEVGIGDDWASIH